jgi:glycosyltransferase involved in cell wall biosynthesis
MKNPKISVCLPTRNGGNYLDKTIKSIVNQRYKNFKLLISDNNSDLKTKKILKKYKKIKSIKIFEQKHTKTGIENHNFLIKKVKTNFFAIIHDDDLWNKDYLYSGIKQLLKNENNIAVFGKIKRFKNNFEIYKTEIENSIFYGSYYKRIINFIKTNYGDKYTFSLINKKKIKNLQFKENIFNPEIVFFYKLISSGNIINESKMIYYKRNVGKKNDLKFRAEFYNLKKNFTNIHGAFIYIFFDLVKKLQIKLIYKLFVYRLPILRLIFKKKLKKV